MSHLLRVDLPAEATTLTETGHSLVAMACPWLRVELEYPTEVSDPRAWMHRAITQDCPQDLSARVIGSIRGRGPRGWPLQLVNVAIRSPSQIHEHRLVGLFEMLGFLASVTASTRELDLYRRTFLSLIVPLVASAQPVWRSAEPAALSDVWRPITPRSA